MIELEQRRLLQEANKAAILQAWENLNLNDDASGFISTSPVILSGQQAELAYETYHCSEEERNANEEGEVFFRMIRLGIEGLSKLDIAHIERDFFLLEQNSPIVIVRSSIFTAPNNESKGFGSGLIILTNKVIEDAMARFPDLADKSVIAVETDSARGNGYDGKGYKEDGTIVMRKGWSSSFAKSLGYALHPSGKWYKIYRELSSAPININE